MYNTKLPKPGQTIVRDLRPQEQGQTTSQHLRILQWNVERGYKLKEIIAELERADAQPDIIALQEVDWGCERSGSLDVGKYSHASAHASVKTQASIYHGICCCRPGDCQGPGHVHLCLLVRVRGAALSTTRCGVAGADKCHAPQVSVTAPFLHDPRCMLAHRGVGCMATSS